MYRKLTYCCSSALPFFTVIQWCKATPAAAPGASDCDWRDPLLHPSSCGRYNWWQTSLTSRQQRHCLTQHSTEVFLDNLVCFSSEIRMLHGGCWFGCKLIAVEIYCCLLESQEHNERSVVNTFRFLECSNCKISFLVALSLYSPTLQLLFISFSVPQPLSHPLASLWSPCDLA